MSPLVGPKRPLIKLNKVDEEFVLNACEKLDITARGYHKLLKVAQTIADLTSGGEVNRQHIAEAIQYRQTEIKSAF